jgi:cytochrome c556
MYVLTGALALAVILTGVQAEDKEDKGPSVKEIMTKAHKGADSTLNKARAALKDKDFDELATRAATLVKLGEDLGKAKFPRGEAESWKTLTSTYVKNAKALEKAAKDNDEATAKKTIGGLNTSCKKCHDTHKSK